MSVQTCEAFCYADASSTDLWKQWKTGGPFVPFSLTGQDNQVPIHTTGMTERKMDRLIESYTMDERYADEQKYWYVVTKCIYDGFANGYKQIYFTSDAFDRYDDFFRVDTNQRLKSVIKDYLNGTIWQCATQNGFLDDYDEYGDHKNIVVGNTNWSFIYEEVGLHKYVVGIDVTNLYGSNYGNVFSPSAEHGISNTKGMMDAIIYAAYCSPAEEWDDDNKESNFERLWGWIVDHSLYDFRSKPANASFSDVQTLLEENTTSLPTNPEDLGSWYKLFPSNNSSGAITIDDKLKFSLDGDRTEYLNPSCLNMLNKLYDITNPERGLWTTTNAGSGWINESTGRPKRKNAYTPDSIFYSHFYALGRCFAFAKLIKMFCDYIDEKSGCTNFHCKCIETQIHSHQWAMLNLDGEFKMFDPCSFVCTFPEQRKKWEDLTDSEKAAYTYNTPVEQMLSNDWDTYGFVYDDGCYIMRPCQEPFNPEHEAYSWKCYPTLTVDNAITAEKVLDGSCYGDYVCDATKDGETGVATVRIDAGGVGEPMFITKDIIDGLDTTFDEFIQNLAASDYYISANALKDSGWNLMYEKCKGDITFTISFPYTRPDWATVPDPVDYAAFIAWCKEHGAHFLVPGEDYGVSSIDSLFQSPEE